MRVVERIRLGDIRFYNTRTRSKEGFEPIRAGEVGIYTCGPTVYGPSHIGNLRSQLMADLSMTKLTMNDRTRDE